MPVDSFRVLRSWVRSDLARYDRAPLATLLHEPQARWLVRLRLTEYAINARGGTLAMFMRWRLQSSGIRLGFTVPPNTCGPGLKLPHWGTLVMSPAARVGTGCTIHPGTSIGQHHGKAPAIGDDVYVGPGAKIYGGIVVGDGAVIGANAIVSRDVAEHTTVVGPRAGPLAE
ncbi:MAG TPA: hypothetical protein VFB41_06205 [Solirubrobacteraceae bacterium]|nr:hypothetical protein [Solirubrobacteraceae bacterium]